MRSVIVPVVLKIKSQDFIQLLPDEFEYDGPLDLTEFNVKKTQIRSENETVLRVEVSGLDTNCWLLQQ